MKPFVGRLALYFFIIILRGLDLEVVVVLWFCCGGGGNCCCDDVRGSDCDVVGVVVCRGGRDGGAGNSD